MSFHQVSLKGALGQLDRHERYAVVVDQASMEAGIYAPHQTDDQTPHDRDEAYVVMNGTGFFVAGDQRVPFSPGDLLFVPAGMEHRFEDFTPDLAVWVVFAGGSAAAP